jgi:hypothetical protein
MQGPALDIKELIYERFQPIFKAYDKDHNSTLEPAELRVLLADNLGVKPEEITQDQLDWHFKRIDGDGDGKITFDEYVLLLPPSSLTSLATAQSRPRNPLLARATRTNLSTSTSSGD